MNQLSVIFDLPSYFRSGQFDPPLQLYSLKEIYSLISYCLPLSYHATVSLDMSCLENSVVPFLRSQLIRIHIVRHSACKNMLTVGTLQVNLDKNWDECRT